MKRRWYTSKTCRLMAMLSLTLSFFFVELIFGTMSKSMAHSFHMLSDVLALIIAFPCMKYPLLEELATETESCHRCLRSHAGSHPANTLGWVRAEALGALVNAVFLPALFASPFAVEAIKMLCEPHEIEGPLNVLIVGIVGLIVNILGIFMFHAVAVPEGGDDEEAEDEKPAEKPLFGDAQPHVVIRPDRTGPGGGGGGHGQCHGDASQLNMHGVFLHVLGDAFGSVIVIVNALIVWQVETTWVRLYLDPALSLIISSTTIPLLRESASILLQAIPAHLDLTALKEKLLQCRNLDDYMRLANSVKEFFHHDQGIHSTTTIQPEFVSPTGVAEEPVVANNCAIVCDAACASEVLCCDSVPSNKSQPKPKKSAGDAATAREESETPEQDTD